MSNQGKLRKIIILLGIVLGILEAYLVVNGNWQVAFGILVLLPGFIFLHKYPWLALAIWLILDPFLLLTVTGAERRVYWIIHRAVPVLAVMVILVSSALQIKKRQLPKLGWIELAMAGYLCLSIFSVWTSNEDPLATTYLLYDRVFIPMCLYLVARFTITDEQSLKRLLPVMFFISISQAAIGILSWSFPGLLPPEWLTKQGRTTGSLVNPSVYTATITFTGLLVLHAALSKDDNSSTERKLGRGRFFQAISIITFCIVIYCIFISFSRASWVAGILVLLGLFPLYPKFMTKLSFVGLCAIALLGGWLLSSQIQWAQERLNSAESERSALSRLPVFYAAYRMFQLKPVFGWGYGNFDQYDRQFQARVADLANDNKDHASHNLYLTTVAEQGIVGLALYMAPVVGLFIATLKVFPKLPKSGFWSRKLLIIFWFVILSFFIVNNFSNMRVVFGLGMWWITLGLIANLVSVNQYKMVYAKAEKRAGASLMDFHLPSTLRTSK